jgi:hypothetical protein
MGSDNAPQRLHSDMLIASLPANETYTENRLVGLLGVVLLFCCLPYISFGPFRTPTEVQPWASLIAWLGFILLLFSGKVRITRFHLAMLGFGVFFLGYVPWTDIVDFEQYIRKSAAFILSAPLVVIAQYLHPRRMLSVLKFAVVCWFLFAIFGLVAPSAYLEVATTFVPRALGAYGERGQTSLAPEATDFGFMMIYMWVLVILASNKCLQLQVKPAPWWLYILIFANIALAGSASGVFALAILSFLFILASDNWAENKAASKSRGALLVGTCFAILLVVLLWLSKSSQIDTGVRGLDLLIEVLGNPKSLIDSTASYRLAHNLVGFYGLLDSKLLGFGAGSYLTSGIDVYREHNIGQLLGIAGWYAENMPVTLSSYALATFPVIIFEFGIFGVIYIAVISVKVFRANTRYKYAVGMLLFLTWSQGVPVAFPLFWILLGLLDWEKTLYSLSIPSTRRR